MSRGWGAFPGFGTTHDPRAYATRVTTFVSRQPSWLLRAAIGAGLIVLVAIALALIVPAILIGMVVLLAGAAFVRARGVLRRWMGGGRAIEPRGDGRQNVRVIGRTQE